MKKLIIWCNQVIKIIVLVEVIPESFKIMSKNDFRNIGDKELSKYMVRI